MYRKAINLDKAKEYLEFLLNEVDRYKDDLIIEDHELEKLKNEIEHFKKQAEFSINIPSSIKNDILNLNLNFKKSKYLLKNIFSSFIYTEVDANRANQDQKLHTLEHFKQDVQRVINNIVLYK